MHRFAVVNREIAGRTSHKRAVEIIVAEGGPWICRHCKTTVTELGRYKHQGMVHHRNEDPWDNRRENLEVLHSSCHHSHHHLGVAKPATVGDAARRTMTGVPKSDEHRKKLSDASKRDKVDCECGTPYYRIHRRWHARTCPYTEG